MCGLGYLLLTVANLPKSKHNIVLCDIQLQIYHIVIVWCVPKRFIYEQQKPKSETDYALGFRAAR